MENNKQVELAACPFCGATRGNALAVWEISGEGWRVGCVNEECKMAKVLTQPYPTKAEAIAAWNKRYVCPDKNGNPVFAGDWCNYFSDADPPVRVRFVWIEPAVRYLVEDEQGLTYPPPPIKTIELIEQEADNGT